jgi:hypoxanthine phosphoribosyltransferase
MKEIDHVVISRRRIDRRVAQMAAELSATYAGRELVIVPVLTGSFMLLADLVRRLPIKMRVDVLAVSSYPGPAIRSQGPKIILPGQLPLRGRHVLILDDVLESGRSLQAVTRLLRQRQPASIRTCVLLRKRSAKAAHLTADFIGFDIGDDFVVGYGMDFNHYYRNLPDVVALKPSAFKARK